MAQKLYSIQFPEPRPIKTCRRCDYWRPFEDVPSLGMKDRGYCINNENKTTDAAGHVIRPIFKGQETCPHFKSLLKLVFEQKPVAL